MLWYDLLFVLYNSKLHSKIPHTFVLFSYLYQIFEEKRNKRREVEKRGSEEFDGNASEEEFIKEKEGRERGSVVDVSEEESKNRDNEFEMTNNKVRVW